MTCIIVTGLPAGGKSTLGRELARVLGWPMLDKDDILEALFASQGVGDAAWRQHLSRRADQLLIERAGALPDVLVVSWWRHPRSAAVTGTPTDWLASRPDPLVEVHCRCSPAIAARRFTARQRHVGHLDGRHDPHQLIASLEAQAALGALGIGRTVVVDTEAGYDLALVVQALGLGPPPLAA